MIYLFESLVQSDCILCVEQVWSLSPRITATQVKVTDYEVVCSVIERRDFMLY